MFFVQSLPSNTTHAVGGGAAFRPLWDAPRDSPIGSKVAYQANQDNQWNRNAQQQQDDGTHSKLLSDMVESRRESRASVL